MKTVAIIPSGGSGKRAGTQLPKQYLNFHGSEMIVYTIQAFQLSDSIDEIVIAADPYYFPLLEKIKSDYGFSKMSMIVPGGNERQDSVYNALKSIDCSDSDLIAVHDAARPLISGELLEKAVISAKSFDNIVVALKAKDTLIKGSDEVETYLDRSDVYYAQTPQIFRYCNLKYAFDEAYKAEFYGTDESMLVQRVGFKVKIIEGSYLNLKITSAEDLRIFEMLSRNIKLH